MRWLDLSIAPAGIKRHERRWREGEDAISQKKAVDLPQRVIFFCFSLQFQAIFSHVDVTSTCETVLETAARSKKKKMTRCRKSTTPPPSHAKKSENHVLVYTSHTTYTTRTTLSYLVLSCLVSSRLFSLLFSSHIYPSHPQSC